MKDDETELRNENDHDEYSNQGAPSPPPPAEANNNALACEAFLPVVVEVVKMDPLVTSPLHSRQHRHCLVERLHVLTKRVQSHIVPTETRNLIGSHRRKKLFQYEAFGVNEAVGIR